MRKLLLLACVCTVAYTALTAQVNAPTMVRVAFEIRFPGATNVKWGKENKHEYEAEFTYKGTNYSANFKDNGDWLETESPITFDLLPQKIKDMYKNPGLKASIKQIMKIETSIGTTKYELELKVRNKALEILYDAEGNPIFE